MVLSGMFAGRGSAMEQEHEVAKTLGDAELLQVVERLIGEENEATVGLLSYLGEVDERKLYLSLGYTSLFDFCVRRLRYSEPAAGRRVRCARVMRAYPAVRGLLLARAVSLTTVSLIAGELTAETAEEIFSAITDRSRQEVESYLAGRRPVSAPRRETVKPVVVVRKPVRAVSEAAPALSLFATPPAESESQQPEPIQEKRYELRFSVDEETMRQIARVQELASGKEERPLSLEEVLRLGLSSFLTRRDPEERAKRREVRRLHRQAEKAEQPKSAPALTRHVPVAVRDEVYRRDKGSCTYCSPDGIQCRSRVAVELDHVMPFSVGGAHSVENLRLLCARHNRQRLP
jgi:5-methylcytosine-specific restriction enzyme A